MIHTNITEVPRQSSPSAMRRLLNAIDEGRAAASLAGRASDRWRLRTDYLMSRLLKFAKWPGYNGLRRVNLRGWPISYRLNRGDLQSLREVVIDDAYACELPFRPRTVLDLGANIGLTSVWMHHCLLAIAAKTEGLQILAVEPNPANARVAEMNFSDNRISGEVICAAAAQKSGEARFSMRDESNLGCLLSMDEAVECPHIHVPVLGINELLGRFPGGCVDLVKMDIEGAELDLLSHGSKWLGRVRALMIEWHEEVSPSAPLIRLLLDAGFTHHLMNVSKQDNLSLLVRES